jgi:hypothetical protein
LPGHRQHRGGERSGFAKLKCLEANGAASLLSPLAQGAQPGWRPPRRRAAPAKL